MKKTLLASAVGLVGAAVAFAGQPVLAKDINATLAAGHPPVFRWVKHASKTFIPAVNKALEGTGHKIIWKEQYAGSLAKVGSVLEAVEEGLAEVGLVSTVFEPAKLTVQNVTYYTPFTSNNPTIISKMIDDLHKTNKDFQATWHENGLEYLGAGIGIDDYLLMSKFPVKSIADLKGKKIGAPGPAVNWLKGTGAVGELLVRGASAADGYWNQRDKSRATFEGEWTRTGDKYEIAENGLYVYCGRTDDMFKVSGIWLSPFEVEQALISHSAILEAAVVAATDDDGLEKPKAFVVLKNPSEPVEPNALKEFVKDKIGKWKYPRWIEVVEDLPKTATGKIQRFKLRDPA